MKSHGPGKYDDACTAVRVALQAQALALIVFGGHSGSGFAVQGSPEFVLKLPEILRRMADSIEHDNAEP